MVMVQVADAAKRWDDLVGLGYRIGKNIGKNYFIQKKMCT